MILPSQSNFSIPKPLVTEIGFSLSTACTILVTNHTTVGEYASPHTAVASSLRSASRRGSQEYRAGSVCVCVGGGCVRVCVCGGVSVCVWGVSVCVQWLPYHRKLFLNTLGFLYTEYVWVFSCNVLQTTILYTVYKMRLVNSCNY